MCIPELNNCDGRRKWDDGSESISKKCLKFNSQPLFFHNFKWLLCIYWKWVWITQIFYIKIQEQYFAATILQSPYWLPSLNTNVLFIVDQSLFLLVMHLMQYNRIASTWMKWWMKWVHCKDIWHWSIFPQSILESYSFQRFFYLHTLFTNLILYQESLFEF